MARKHHHESHENHERWLLTYADLITLLLAFFIILYALSDVNKSKFEAFSEALRIQFKNPDVSSPVSLQLNTQTSTAQQQQQALKMMQAVKENNDLRKVKQKIDQKIKDNNLENSIQTNLTSEGLSIMLSNDILFASGKADLNPNIAGVISQVGQILTSVNNPVKISGHTDTDPIIQPSLFKSNWELSTARSVSVLHAFIDNNPSLDPSRFSAAGYGQYKPIADNSTSDGKKKNRRVEVFVERMHADGLLTSNKN